MEVLSSSSDASKFGKLRSPSLLPEPVLLAVTEDEGPAVGEVCRSNERCCRAVNVDVDGNDLCLSCI
jgi:hypothetical protein